MIDAQMSDNSLPIKSAKFEFLNGRLKRTPATNSVNANAEADFGLSLTFWNIDPKAALNGE